MSVIEIPSKCSMFATLLSAAPHLKLHSLPPYLVHCQTNRCTRALQKFSSTQTHSNINGFLGPKPETLVSFPWVCTHNLWHFIHVNRGVQYLVRLHFLIRQQDFSQHKHSQAALTCQSASSKSSHYSYAQVTTQSLAHSQQAWIFDVIFVHSVRRLKCRDAW